MLSAKTIAAVAGELNMSQDRTWLRASYYMPSTYSIRVPVASPFCAKALPTPGPATVQLALIRSAIELYGMEMTSNELFPHIVECEPKVQPPDSVAITSHLVHMYKADDSGRLRGAVGYREFCHCEGLIRVFVRVQNDLVHAFAEILQMIGYWGRCDSLASCIEVSCAQPEVGSCIQRFDKLPERTRTRAYFSAFVGEFIRSDIRWIEIVPRGQGRVKSPTSAQLYVWPLKASKLDGAAHVLRFSPFA